MHFCDIENRETKEIVPGVRIRSFWGDKMLVSIVDLDPRSVVPRHNHPHEQCGTVLSGEIEMVIDGEARWLKPGDTYIIPGNVDHKATAGNTGSRVMDVFNPVREEYQY